MIYPPSPTELPKDLIKLTRQYHLKSILAVMAILLFFVLYALMVTALGYLVYYAVIFNVIHWNKGTIILKVAAITGSVMLFVFTLKFIFKLNNNKPKNRIKLDKEQHKELWNFVNKVSTETGAPKAKNIYIDPDINAYVSYTNVWLSLFLPVRKELTIGLGLVDTLTLSEFKAVISHEFGHFAQRSMKIGSYINSANTIIFDMIYSRDKWDDLLEQWRSADIRLSIAAWIITPVIWLIRQFLLLFYSLLNIAHSSLSREMEFNADKFAVKTTGSKPIISALWKLDTAFEMWNELVNNAFLASKNNIVVSNLYTHNQLSLKRIEGSTLEQLSKLPLDAFGNKQYFVNSQTSKTDMYASHPENSDREKNVKTPFIDCVEDNRSSWLLFEKEEMLQQESTRLIYEQYFNLKPEKISHSDDLEKFILQEDLGKELTKRYHDTFVNRYLNIALIDTLKQKAILFDKNFREEINLLEDELKALMQPVKELEMLMEKVISISNGTSKETSIKYNGVDYKKKKLNEVYQLIFNDRETLFNTKFKDWDFRFCTLYLAISKQHHKESDFLNILNQHQFIVSLYKEIVTAKDTIYKDLEVLQQKTEVEQRELDNFTTSIKNKIYQVNNKINDVDNIEFVPLPNIENVEQFKKSLNDHGKIEEPIGRIFENGGFDSMLNDFNYAVSQCQRIEQKSIAMMLSFNNELELLLDKEL